MGSDLKDHKILTAAMNRVANHQTSLPFAPSRAPFIFPYTCIQDLPSMPCRCQLASPLLQNAGNLGLILPLLLHSCAHGACTGLGSCTQPLLAHVASLNCSSDGPRHMECSVTCEQGFVLRSGSGKILGYAQVSTTGMAETL